jgi:hypothetical protein
VNTWLGQREVIGEKRKGEGRGVDAGIKWIEGCRSLFGGVEAWERPGVVRSRRIAGWGKGCAMGCLGIALEEHVHEEEQLNLMRGVSRTKGERVSRKGGE